MPNVPVPIIGPTYTSRSTDVSKQVTQNFYIEVDQNSENIASFQPFPGLKSFATTGAGADRGMGEFDGVLYKVTGTTLYSISSLGVSTSIGSIPGSGRCQLEEASNTLVITTGTSKPYTYDGTTLIAGTDTDLPNASSVTYIKNRVVYDGNDADVVFADLGDPLSVDSSNITAADSNPDDIEAVFAYKDQLFALGNKSISPYYNKGTGNPPYAPIQNAVNNKLGLKAVHSVAANANAMYFLGSDLVPYRTTGLQPQSIGNPSLGKAFATYVRPQSAIGICFTLHNQNFYYLTFPGAASWLFSEGAGWTNLSYGVDGDPHLISSYSKTYNKHLVADRRNGNVYELDFDTFDDNGDIIIKQRDTIKITGKELGFPGKEIFMDKFELVAERGVGLIAGQGSNPKIMMSFSDDGGKTFSPEEWVSLGEMGDFTIPIVWNDLGSFYERMFRFKVSDPVKVVLISANADISVGA